MDVVHGQGKVFIGSSSESSALADLVCGVARKAGMQPLVWHCDAFRPGRTLLEQIERLPLEFDAAVFLMTPDVVCERNGRTVRAPVANVLFEYGYMSARLTRERVAICRFGKADLPSDLLGVKLVETPDLEPQVRALPDRTVRELTAWLDAIHPLSEGMSPTTLLHGYSGRWKIQNRFELWHMIPIAGRDRVYFDGVATLVLPPDGQAGSGMMYGETYVALGDYRARLDVVNEIRNASVGERGELFLHIEVVRRHLAQERGDPPNGEFRDEMQSKAFDVRLTPVPESPGELRGVHVYRRAGELYSSAVETYVHIG